jgi:hypothetical protein
MRYTIGTLVGILLLTVGITFAGGSVVGQAHAYADTSTNYSQLCSMNNDFGLSHGACVSTFASGGHGSALFSSLCDLIAQSGGYPFDLFFFQNGNLVMVVVNNHGNCISSFNRYMK